MKIITKISVEEYLQNEAQAEVKSEYHNGEVVAMAGAQLSHNIVVSNLIRYLGNCLDGKNCLVLPSDMLLHLPDCEKFVYPDVMIVCGEVQLDKAKRQGLDVLLNPTVIIEVLSESTADYDRTEKLHCYLMLNSLQQYVLVDSEKVHISTYTRTTENDWLLHIEQNINESIHIHECNVALKDIYNKIGFEMPTS
jgi:Uma2 family endonuclease